MTQDVLTEFFCKMTLINFVFLLVATIGIKLMGGFAKRTHAKTFGLDEAELPLIYFKFLASFKMLWLLFNFTPWLALTLM